MFINGEPISKYGGIMLGTPRVSNAEYTSTYSYQRTRSTIRHLSHDIGMKTLEVNVAFLGDSIHEIQMKRSVFRAALIGLVDLSFTQDGFSYFSEYLGDAELESEYNGAVMSKFKFSAVQHLPLKKVTGTKVFCESTVPITDCKLTAIMPVTGTNFILGPVKFLHAFEGTLAVADGINGLITEDGYSLQTSFVHLPYLVPGDNEIETTADPSTVTIEYYPTFL